MKTMVEISLLQYSPFLGMVLETTIEDPLILRGGARAVQCGRTSVTAYHRFEDDTETDAGSEVKAKADLDQETEAKEEDAS